jgi:hypothetical protein
MRTVVLLLPLVACTTSTTWLDSMHLDPAPKPIHVGTPQQFTVTQDAEDTSFEPTGGGDGFFPGTPTNWTVRVASGAITVTVTSKAADTFDVTGQASGVAKLDLTGENGATLSVDLQVIP